MIIGILGEAGSGKDTAGKALVEHHGYYSIALADPIKVFCQWMFDWSADRLWGPSEQRNEPDESLPFVRCPSCGFLPYDTTIDKSANDIECPICVGHRVPEEWFAHLSARYALQHLGTEWARTLKDSCHIDFALRRAELIAAFHVHSDPLWHVLPHKVRSDRYLPGDQRPKGVYISDCRFKNEVYAIQAAGGKVFRIVRDQRDDNTTTGISGHASEMEQKEIADDALDGIIYNHGTLQQLRQAMKDLL
ncbi:MAG: nucleoside/nucleotide kinase family protein [Planctomycetota bacterium]|jgi:hypothetical protein